MNLINKLNLRIANKNNFYSNIVSINSDIFTHELSLFFFFINPLCTAAAPRTVEWNDHQMYFRGSIVGKASEV